DRLIADRVVCKIVFNDRTGTLRWIFRPDNEYFPIYSEDDFEDLIGAHFIKPIKYLQSDGEEVDALQKQTIRLDDNNMAYDEEATYREDELELRDTMHEQTTLAIYFIPIQEFPVNELLSESLGDSEISALREQNDIHNQMIENAIVSLKFKMFEITVI